MTTETRRLRIPYPSDGQDPYYPAFDAMVKAIDAMGFADVSDRNTLFYGGGNVLWGEGYKLTFDQPIYYVEPTYGQRQVLYPTDNSAIVIPPGHFLFTELSRGTTSPVDLEPLVTSSVTPSVSASVLAWHDPLDGALIWRSGARQLLGEAIGDVGNSGASDTAEYILTTRTASLPNSRTLAAGGGLVYADGGPQRNVTFALEEVASDIAGQPFTFASLEVDAYGRVVSASSGSPTAFFERHIETTVEASDANFTSVSGLGLKPFGDPVPTGRLVLFESDTSDYGMARSWRSVVVKANVPYSTTMNYSFKIPLDARRYGNDDHFMKLCLGGSGLDPNPEVRLTLRIGGVAYAAVKVGVNAARRYTITASDFGLENEIALAGRRAVLSASYINYAGIGTDYTVDYGPLDVVFLNTDPAAP